MPYETSGPVNFRFKGCRVVFYMFIHILKEYFVSNSGDPDRTPLSVAVSDLDLHCSYFSHKRHWSYMAYILYFGLKQLHNNKGGISRFS